MTLLGLALALALVWATVREVQVRRARRSCTAAGAERRVATHVAATLDPDEVVRRTLDAALELAAASTGAVLLAGPDGDEVAASRGVPSVRAAAHHEAPLRVPLVHRETVLGALHVHGATTAAGAPLAALAEVAGVALVNARLFAAERATATDLARQAFSDPLTGLANRALFVDRVGHALARRSREGSAVAVVLLDLDDFKRINDSLGHAAGDRLLRSVGDRLRGTLRDADTVARLGGDEFAALVECVDEAEVALVAARVVAALDVPFPLGERVVAARASVGVASSTGGDGAEELLRDADTAMYLAKGQGGGRVAVFEPSMHATVLERLELGADLEGAVERAELVLHYQPIVDVRDGRITGFEALVRWDHPERGLLGPDAFIPLAEQTGLVVAIDRWVLLRACCQGREWQERQHVDEAPLTVGVNLSTRQLEHDAVVDLVALALEVSGLAPEHLVLEITESFLLSDSEGSVRRLEALKELGVRLAIDDFGTGYASLSYLRQLPVDVLKIDRSFTSGLGRSNEDAALVRAIVRMGRSLDLEVVAEGVETAEQLAVLRRLGCRRAQGWLFARPVVAPAFASLLLRAPALPPVPSAADAPVPV